MALVHRGSRLHLLRAAVALLVYSCSLVLPGTGSAQPDASGGKVFLVAFTNDRHGYIEGRVDTDSGRAIAGADSEATLLRTIRQAAQVEGVPLLLVDAGDLFQGTPVVNESRGKCMVDVLNALHFHLTTFGNHEFDYGQVELLERMNF